MNNKHGYRFYGIVVTIACSLALASVPFLFQLAEDVMKLSKNKNTMITIVSAIRNNHIIASHFMIEQIGLSAPEHFDGSAFEIGVGEAF